MKKVKQKTDEISYKYCLAAFNDRRIASVNSYNGEVAIFKTKEEVDNRIE